LNFSSSASLARFGNKSTPPAERHVVGAAFQQTRLEVPLQPLAQPGKVLPHQLLLPACACCGDDHAFVMAHGTSDGRHKIARLFSRAGSGLHDQGPPRAWIWRPKQHLKLRLRGARSAGSSPARAPPGPSSATNRPGSSGGFVFLTGDVRFDNFGGRGARIGIWAPSGVGRRSGRWTISVRRDESQHRLL